MYWDSLTATGVYSAILILASVAYLSRKQRPETPKRHARERWTDRVLGRIRGYLTLSHVLRRT